MDNHKILSEYQSGFRKGYSTVDSIFVLTSIANDYLHKKKKLYLFFVDFKAAFDTVDRRSLFLKLSNLGISFKMLKILSSMYERNTVAVWDGNELSPWFDSNLGVKQGCLLSPILFSLYVDDIVSTLQGGVELGTSRIKVLMYADDMVLLADSADALQTMINALHVYCVTWSLQINCAKSKVMIIKDGRGRSAREDNWCLNGVQLEVVKQYKYLGIILTSNMSFKMHAEQKLKDSKAALNSTWKHILGKQHVNHSLKYKVFLATARAIMCYAAQVWGYMDLDEEREDILHFMGRCPILSEIRMQHWNSAMLDSHACIDLLNGLFTWRSLADFLLECHQYRREIINEYI
ncbi:hypothetical protein ACLKA6_004303 [Drosophila palustris]